MTPGEQQQVNAVYEASFKEALSAQRNEHANKEAHWFAQHMAAQERIKQLEKELAEVKELTPSPVNLESVGDADYGRW